MALTPQQYTEIRKALDECRNPLFFHHDDPDGVCSFLLLYQYKKEGTGVIVKSQPCVNVQFLRKVEEVQPDMIFVSDLALVAQEFIDAVKVPIIWIDHHEPQKMQGSHVRYYNPRASNHEDGFPAAYLCYHVNGNPDYMWLGMTGTVGDWQLTDLAQEFSQQHPDLLPPQIDRPEVALFDSPIGKLAKIISFILKGKTTDVKKYISFLKKIQNPYEILEQQTPEGKKIYKRYEIINKVYDELYQRAISSVGEGKLILFTYDENEYSMTGELANELLYRNPDKVILIARQKGGDMRCSLRSSKLVLPPIVSECIEGFGGHGGGHEHACGCSVPEQHFKEFVERLKKKIE